jgi:Methyltransferase FkbM domain
MEFDMITLCKRIASKAQQSMGYTVIPTWRSEHFLFAQDVQRVRQAFEIDCVLDVGANKGLYHDFLRSEVRYEGQIVSFEPIPDQVEILRRRAALDREWFIEDCALGRSLGQATFNIMASTEFSSFLQPIIPMREALEEE